MTIDGENKKQQRPVMGEWCVTTNEAQKTRCDVEPTISTRYGDNHHYVEWKHRYIGWQPTPVKAMFIGWRMKREGIFWTSGSYEDYQQNFKQEKSIEVWMFVTNARSKPFPVFPADVERIERRL